MSTATVRAGIDSWVLSTNPSANYGQLKSIRVASGAFTVNGFLYLKNPVPLGATVLSAKLRLYSVGASGATYTVSLQRIQDRWSESGITYNNQPAVTGSVISLTKTASVDALEWEFDVTSFFQTMAAGAINRGVRLTTTSTTERQFYSLNASDHQPVLVVEWSDAPDAPSELAPSGGASVSLAKPVLSFNFHDVSGSTAMQACQVQINGTNSFTAPAFDSGTVLTSDPELDLATTAYAGLAVAGVAWWRVRVQDAAGIWSAWSSPTSWTRIAKGALTIDNPAASPNDFVSDSTPELLWTLTGGTAIAWRVVIADDADPTHPLLDTGRRSGAPGSYVVPKDIITDESTTYRLTLRVWDDPTRVATPTDTVFIEAVRTFTFQNDPTPNQVTSLAAAQSSLGQPAVVLTWDRATAPDGFTISRDGVIIDHDIDPADLNTGGTSYRYTDYTPAAHVTNTWKVYPYVNGKLGPSPSVSFSYEVDEVWLVHIDTERLVPIVSTADQKGQITYDMPETAGVYRPVNSQVAVRVVQGQSGLEGHIAGLLTNRNGHPVSDWQDRLLWMKLHAETERFRLIIGNKNYHVTIGNVVISPAGAGDKSHRAVAFDFWSVDGVVR